MTNEQVVQVLEKAKEFLQEPSQWMQGGYHRYADETIGGPIPAEGSRWLGTVSPVASCLSGAISHAEEVIKTPEAGMVTTPYRQVLIAINTLYPLPNKLGWNSVVEWNDTEGRTHAEVIAILEVAIAAATPRGEPREIEEPE